MRITLKAASYIVIAGLFSVALSGCGKKEAAAPNLNTIIVWGFEDADTWKPIISAYKENNDHEIKYEKQPFDSFYESRLLNSIASGEGPDLFALPNQWVYRHKEKLAPMPSKMAQNYNLDDEYVPMIKQSLVFDSKIFGMSPSAQPLELFYNPTLFEQRIDEIESSEDAALIKKSDQYLRVMPKTWDQFVETSKLLTKKSASGITQSGVALGTDKISNAQDLLYLLMYQNGTNIISDNLKTATFSLSKETATDANEFSGRRALDFYTSFATPNSPNFSWSDSAGNDVDAFINGKVAMIFGYPELENYFEAKFPNFTYQKTFVPQLHTDNSKIVDYGKFTAFSVNKLSSKSSEAWELINALMLTSDSFLSATDLPASTKNSDSKISFEQRSDDSPEALSLLSAKTLVRGRYPEEFDNAIKYAIFETNNKTQEVAGALNTAANAATLLLNKTSW